MTAVGDLAHQNLRVVGDISLRFDGQPHAVYTAKVYLVGPVTQAVNPRLYNKNK
ncbi:PTS glucitol/sorbitol transporter subunit IIA [Enterobacter hormaechei]